MTTTSAADLQLELASAFLGRSAGDGAPRWQFDVVPADGAIRDVYLFNRADETRGVVGRLWKKGDPTTEIIPVHEVIRLATAIGCDEDIMRFYRTAVESGDVFQLAFGMQVNRERATKNSFDRSDVGVGYVAGRDGVLDTVTDSVLGWNEAQAAGLRFVRPVNARFLETNPGTGDDDSPGVRRLREFLMYVTGLEETDDEEERALRGDGVRALLHLRGRSTFVCDGQSCKPAHRQARERSLSCSSLGWC